MKEVKSTIAGVVATGESVLVALGTRGEEMSLPVDLPAEWAVENVHASYAFASSANGKRTSATTALEIATE